MRVELAGESNKTMKSCWKSYVLCVFAAAVFQPIVAESEGMLRCTSTSSAILTVITIINAVFIGANLSETRPNMTTLRARVCVLPTTYRKFHLSAFIKHFTKIAEWRAILKCQASARKRLGAKTTQIEWVCNTHDNWLPDKSVSLTAPRQGRLWVIRRRWRACL